MKEEKEQKSNTLEQIRRLLILGLIKQGVQGKEIAVVLGVDPATISRIISPPKAAKESKNGKK